MSRQFLSSFFLSCVAESKLTQTTLFTFTVVASAILGPVRAAETWPQFRGVNSAARSTSRAKLPERIGPQTNVIWKTELPPGHSSPVVFGKRIYLSAVQSGKLLTLGVDRVRGVVMWQVETPHEQLESLHRIGSHAQATPATDGQRVISFFGSSGLFCYDTLGKLLWQRRMGPFNNDFGAAISPILADDWIILCQDHDTGSFIAAIDKHTGDTVWQTDRSEFPRNYCTPVIVESAGSKQIVVAGTLRIVGYDFATGKELWTVRGTSRGACSSPAIDDSGTVYIATWAGGAEPGSRIRVPPFDDVVSQRDKNRNGTLEEDELVEGGQIHRRFSQVDRDKTGTITRTEYEYFRGLFDKSRNVLLAIKPGGRGDVTKSHVVWEYEKAVPFVASPLYVDGSIFGVKDGGILTSLDAATGRLFKTKRLPGTKAYYSSPVAGDDKIYLVNVEGRLTVVSAHGNWEVLSTVDFGEDVYATPAIVDGHIYLRTVGHLYCFGLPNPP